MVKYIPFFELIMCIIGLISLGIMISAIIVIANMPSGEIGEMLREEARIDEPL